MKRKSKLTIAIATAVLVVLGAVAVYAQDKYTLKSPSGIAFSDFRGYEDWAVVSSARTDEVPKVIVANPTMIKAYKAGVPGNGQPFPDFGPKRSNSCGSRHCQFSRALRSRQHPAQELPSIHPRVDHERTRTELAVHTEKNVLVGRMICV
jgi:hypothetical protein